MLPERVGMQNRQDRVPGGAWRENGSGSSSPDQYSVSQVRGAG